MDAPSLFPRETLEQFRMTRLQVYNWGTFSDLHDIPISSRGFLFVGRSGSGKSTLLDAFSALLVPPRWIDFNAAAREAARSGRDRNLVTYIRGAWAEQKDGDSGEIATRYLRTGSTWSALGLSYRNTLGQCITLAQLLWLRGNANGSTDVRRCYLIMEREFDLRELEDFGQSNFDLRKLKHAFATDFVSSEFPVYRERFCRLLGIENEMALRLLHKTQSAKNLGDLNLFLRDFMLDKPETFAVAERLVSEFGELNAAHQAVVTAREQVQILTPARERHQHRQALALRHSGLSELRLGADSYRETRRIELLKQHVNTLRIDTEGKASEVSRCQSTLDNQSAHLRDLERAHRNAGGERIEEWEREKTSLIHQRTQRLNKREQAQTACRTLGWQLPDTPQSFAELLGKARAEVEHRQQHNSESRARQFQLDREKQTAETEFMQARAEVAALERQPSNIPAAMLEMRTRIANAIGISESALPFAGELIEVKPDQMQWQGSIERVLRGFALSLLVDDHDYPALAQHLNQIHLGQRLVYYRVGALQSRQDKTIGSDSLVFKVNVKDGIYTDWLKMELRQRFDYTCVDSATAFRKAERAITREGQLKHSQTRHEKDDRRQVNDRRNWVLGFDNREKLAIFKQQAQELAATVARLEQEINTLTEQEEHRAARAMQCQTLVNLQWQEIDVAPLLDRIAHIEQQIHQACEGNTALQQISERIEQQKAQVIQAEKQFQDARLAHQSVLKDIATHTQKLDTLLQDPTITPLTPHQSLGLDERFAHQSGTLTLDNLEKVAREVERGLNDEIAAIVQEMGECEKIVETRFADFKRQWPLEASELDATLASAGEFFEKLNRLETDGLSAHEQRFFELLQSQSHQNLAALSTYLSDARKAIFERMDLVNDSLRQAPFNQTADQRTHLQIIVEERPLAEVKAFRQAIQQALSHAWDEDRTAAEERFVVLHQLVERLSSQEPEHRRWRDLVLDVRQHVEFIGQELDENEMEVEIYRSGAGKSGGQRQKLATTCLAAALRYQLGGHDRGVPMYAPVILDEAFDKADNEFTALAMNIFANFGFQMIVATPLKSVMTLEPFIGGACFVDISDRRHSSILLIEYDADQQRLRLPQPAREEASGETA